MTGPDPNPIPLTAINDVIIREEWAHLRGYGLADADIARRLGIRIESISQQKYRASR